MPKIPPIKKSSVVVRTKKSMVRVKDGMVIVSTVFSMYFPLILRVFHSKEVRGTFENKSGQNHLWRSLLGQLQDLSLWKEDDSKKIRPHHRKTYRKKVCQRTPAPFVCLFEFSSEVTTICLIIELRQPSLQVTQDSSSATKKMPFFTLKFQPHTDYSVIILLTILSLLKSKVTIFRIP